ncbi:MAG: hypothetical protein ACLSCV_06065 [Acutalibacteraceae bacterium]
MCCVIVRVAILALDNIAIYDISLGSIAAIILILFAAQYGGALQAVPLQVPQQVSCWDLQHRVSAIYQGHMHLQD